MSLVVINPTREDTIATYERLYLNTLRTPTELTLIGLEGLL